MQSYYNDISDSQKSRKRLWWIVIAAVVVIIGILFLISEGGHNSSNFPKADQEQSTTFEGMSAFIDKGLTTDQVNRMIKEFSKFSPVAKTVSIDTESLSPGPRDPNKVSPFIINFNLAIDSKPYKGSVSYFDLSSVRLILRNLSGQQVFDSGSSSPTE
jgi:hypothetical protein